MINLNEDFEAMVLRSKEDGKHLYHASGKESACFNIFEPSGLLHAHGFLFDTVHTVGNIAPDDWGECRQWLEDWLRLAQDTANLRSSGVADNELMEEFCRTLIADQDDRGNRATADFYNPYIDGETLATHPAKLAEAFEQESVGLSHRLSEVCDGRLMLGTSKGYLGVAGLSCKPKDIICILLGAGVPFIIRSRGSEYILIGEACTYYPVMERSLS